jgi:hypothetical protein
MNALERLLRADASRRTRFHTSTGTLCLHPLDFLYSLATAARRQVTGRLPEVPWIPRPALRYLREHVRDAVVFEYSMGMSTLWYARQAARVHAVEHDPGWYQNVRGLVAGIPNVKLALESDSERYVSAIERAGEPGFDIVSIDGIHRLACAQRVLPFLRPSGLLVVDNTDDPAHRGLPEFLETAFGGDQLLRFSGYPPACGHPNQTTICVKRS